MKTGRELAALRPFLTGRLPSGPFPTSGFLAAFASGFALGFRSWPIAFVVLAGLDLGLGTCPPIRGQGSADIVGVNERRAQLVATHIPLIGAVSISFAAGHWGRPASKMCKGTADIRKRFNANWLPSLKLFVKIRRCPGELRRFRVSRRPYDPRATPHHCPASSSTPCRFTSARPGGFRGRSFCFHCLSTDTVGDRQTKVFDFASMVGGLLCPRQEFSCPSAMYSRWKHRLPHTLWFPTA
jgi:hypothetical protein